MAGGLRRGMRMQFRRSRVSWNGTGHDQGGRVCDRNVPKKAAGEPGGIWYGRGEGVCAKGMVAKQSAPDDTQCIRT